MTVINILIDFIRNIAAFIVFSGLIRVISPIRYKRYINLCLNLALIALMFEPISAAFAFIGGELAAEDETAPAFSADADERGTNILAESYAAALSAGAKTRVEQDGDYLYVDSVFTVETSPESENFGAILNADIMVRDASKKGFIGVEPTKEQQENKKLRLKKIISDFYNLSPDNINIIVQP